MGSCTRLEAFYHAQKRLAKPDSPGDAYVPTRPIVLLCGPHGYGVDVHRGEWGGSTGAPALIGTRDPASKAQSSVFLNCPRCGLSIKPRARWLAIEPCLRCLARARVRSGCSPQRLPTAELYPDAMAPSLEHEQTVKAVKPGGR